jgi:hypothetical protein
VIPEICQVLAVNSMGNCFIKCINDHYWRVCPEELSATLIAKTEQEVQVVFDDSDFKEDWQLLGLIDLAEEHLGKLNKDECYVMIKPAVIGGEYSVNNLRIGSIYEYLSLTGDMAFQIKDLKDGDEVSICLAE